MGLPLRIGIVLALVVAGAVLFVVLRDDGGGDAPPGGDQETARFELEAGAEGPGQVEDLRVRQGQHVVISVTLGWESDIHLHGYDLSAETGPGRPPAEFDFVADTPGRFTLEAHEGWQTLARLQVDP